MIYKDAEIRENIVSFINETKQPELAYVIHYCIGYYGYITKQIWNVIIELGHENIIVD